MIRVQAMKTLDAFLERVKTLTADYPETVLPPPQATDGASGTNIPRIGTPQTDESWAGWAISSFTKNLSKAVGELESKNTLKPNGSSAKGTRSLPESSVGRLSVPNTTMARSTSPSPSSGLRNSFTAPGGESKSASTVFGNSDNEDNDPDAWGGLEEDTFFDAPSETLLQNSTESMAVHENDELDFASLAQPRKKELPKGLSRPAASSITTRSSLTTSPKAPSRATNTGMKPVIGETAMSTKRPTSAVVTTARKPATTVAAAKKTGKMEATRMAEKDPWGDGDGWGDGW